MIRPALIMVVLAAALAPRAAALDLLPAESRLGDGEGLLVVRADGALHVLTEPPILVSAGDGDRPAPAPRTFEPRGLWRGMEGVVELRLFREDASAPIHVYLNDDTDAGAWIEWAGASSAVSSAEALATPGAGGLLGAMGLAVGAAFMRGRAARRACGTR